MKRQNGTWQVRERIVRHCYLAFPDQSTNPQYWNRWGFLHEGRKIDVFLQRYCNGRRRGQVNYIRIRADSERVLLADLRKIANWLTDLRAKQMQRTHNESLHQSI